MAIYKVSVCRSGPLPGLEVQRLWKTGWRGQQLFLGKKAQNQAGPELWVWGGDP